MATQWWREQWRKLYTKVDAQWLALPVSARGLADELLKYADEEGRLCRSDIEGGIPAEIARILGARRNEYKRIADDIEALTKDTFLVVVDGWLCIRNYVAAQERLSPEALRQRRKRERDNKEEHDRDNERDMSRDESVTTPRDCHRDTIRNDTSTESLSLLPSPGSVSESDSGVSAVFAQLNVARVRSIRGAKELRATDENLKHIRERIENGATVDDCLHVIAVCEGEVKDGGDPKWFDQVTPFRKDNFAKRLAMSPDVSNRKRSASGLVTGMGRPGNFDDIPEGTYTGKL